MALVLPGVASAARVKVPTEGGFQVRPDLIGWTGDGTGYLGGFTSQRSLRRPIALTAFGRLHWTTYNAREGRAYGADWIDNGKPDNAVGTFYPHRVNVRVSRPRHGVFTRLSFNLAGRLVTLHSHGDSWEQPL